MSSNDYMSELLAMKAKAIECGTWAVYSKWVADTIEDGQVLPKIHSRYPDVDFNRDPHKIQYHCHIRAQLLEDMLAVRLRPLTHDEHRLHVLSVPQFENRSDKCINFCLLSFRCDPIIKSLRQSKDRMSRCILNRQRTYVRSQSIRDDDVAAVSRLK